MSTVGFGVSIFPATGAGALAGALGWLGADELALAVTLVVEAAAVEELLAALAVVAAAVVATAAFCVLLAGDVLYQPATSFCLALLGASDS